MAATFERGKDWLAAHLPLLRVQQPLAIAPLLPLLARPILVQGRTRRTVLSFDKFPAGWNGFWKVDVAAHLHDSASETKQRPGFWLHQFQACFCRYLLNVEEVKTYGAV